MSTLSAAIETAVRLIEGEISSTEYRIAICELDKIETHDIKADVAKWRDQIKALKAVGSSTPAPAASQPIAWEALTAVIRPLIEPVCGDSARKAKEIADALLAGPLRSAATSASPPIYEMLRDHPDFRMVPTRVLQAAYDLLISGMQVGDDDKKAVISARRELLNLINERPAAARNDRQKEDRDHG